MTQAQPSRSQQALYRFVMQNAPISREATLTPHHFPGAISDQQLVATARLHGEASAYLTLTLPQLSNKVFLAVTDAYPETFAELVASFGAESETNDALDIGHAESLETQVLGQFGWDAVLMTAPNQLLKKFPATTCIGQEEYEFILLTLITDAEYRHWRKSGYASLMHKFGAQKRDLFRFYQKTVGDTRVAMHPKNKISKAATKARPARPAAPPAGAPRSPASTPAHKPSHTVPVIPTPPSRAQQPSRQTPRSAPARPHPAAQQAAAHADLPLAPAFPAAGDEAEFTVPPDNLPHDPMRVNLGVEPSEAFIMGDTDALSVGRIPPNISKHVSGPAPNVRRSTGPGRAPRTAAQGQASPALQHRQPNGPAPAHPGHMHQAVAPAPQRMPQHTARQHSAPRRRQAPPVQTQQAHPEPAERESVNQGPPQFTAPRPAQFESRALSQSSPSRAGVVSKRMQAAHKPKQGAAHTAHTRTRLSASGPTKAERAANAAGKQNINTKKMSSNQAKRRHDQLSALDEAITDQWASSVVTLNRQRTNHSMGKLGLSAHAPDQTPLFELNQTKNQRPRSKWQVLSETALGTLLLVGGLFTTLFFVDTQVPTASVFPGVFAVAGIVTLTSAFRDAIKLERAEAARSSR